MIVGLTACVVGLVAAGCGDSDSGSTDGDDKPEIVIANKGFTENNIVAEIYAEALEERGYDVEIKSLASTAIADAAIRKGEIQMYPDYTTTLLTDVLKVQNPPTDAAAQATMIKERYNPDGLDILDVAPFNNDNQVACTKEAVDAHKLTDLSSLGRASGDIVYSANPEHTARADGLPLLQKEYGVKFKRVIKVDIGLRYRPIEQGQAQCVYAFGTDPKIAAEGLVVLTDDKGKFQGAPYQGVPVVTKAFLDSAPADFAETVNAVSAKLTSEEVRRMNAAVDLDKEDPEDVAEQFVKDQGLAD